jgi:hypothetical protein
MSRKFPAIQQNRQNINLFYDTIYLKECCGSGIRGPGSWIRDEKYFRIRIRDPV